MLSSIHPLGERGRRNRWSVTVGAFTLGAGLAGAAVGGVLGAVGDLIFGTGANAFTLLATGTVAIGAAVLDLSGTRAPSTNRQVNEHWIGHYRGWVYGGAFGAQLGAGFVTYVVTWSVYAVFLMELFSASAIGGAVIGMVFGVGRSLTLLTAIGVRRPSDLSSFHRIMARLGPPVRTTAASMAGVLGVVALVGGLL